MEPSENQHSLSEYGDVRCILSNTVLFQGCNCLSSAPFWADFGPKIRVAAFLRDHLSWGVTECIVWDCKYGAL